MLNEVKPRLSRCNRCDTCDGFPYQGNAEADAQVVCVDPALQHQNATMITQVGCRM